jgi:hypothetical protein
VDVVGVDSLSDGASSLKTILELWLVSITFFDNTVPGAPSDIV